MAERRPWRAVYGDLFRFTTTDLRDLHVAIMAAFEQAAVLAPALNLEQVRTAVAGTGWDEPLDDDGLQRALASLTGWGLLEATQDHTARYVTPEEFERRNLQWSLTALGEAAVGGVLNALDALRHAVRSGLAGRTPSPLGGAAGLQLHARRVGAARWSRAAEQRPDRRRSRRAWC